MTETRCVAVVGSREASPDGIRRAERLARELVDRSFTVVSGLARGIDSAAHRAAIARGGLTISVVGTPLGSCYPKENAELQEEIARDHLLRSEEHTSELQSLLRISYAVFYLKNKKNR